MSLSDRIEGVEVLDRAVFMGDGGRQPCSRNRKRLPSGTQRFEAVGKKLQRS